MYAILATCTQKIERNWRSLPPEIWCSLPPPCLPFLYFTGNSFKFLYFFQGWYDTCNIIVVIRQSEWAIGTKLLIFFSGHFCISHN